MELYAELAMEAADAEIYSVMVIEAWDFRAQEHVLVGARILRQPHDRDQFLKLANR